MPLISIIIGTARRSYSSLPAFPTAHHLKRTFDSLARQTFCDFEVIVSDALYKDRDLRSELLNDGNWPFEFKIVHPQSWWHDKKMWSLQNGFNNGAEASSGGHLLFCGDCFTLDQDALAKAIKLIDRGMSPHFLCVYTSSGIPIDPRDSRFQFIANAPFLPPNKCPWTWFYGYCFVSRDDFFAVNGWDENFDGEKSLGDVEMGSRLEMSGRLKMCLSKDLIVYEELHLGIDPSDVRLFHGFPVRSNYDLIYLMRNKGISRANCTKYTEEECQLTIQSKVMNLANWPTMPNEGELFELQKHWAQNPEIRELKC